jgi:hypothetical protein
MSEHTSHDSHVAVSSDRSFGWVMAGFFTIVGLWPLWSGGPVRWTLVIIALAFAAVTLVRPALLNPLNLLWHKLGLLLGKIVAPLVMGALFFLVVTPLGLLRRLTGADPLRRRKKSTADSYWIPRGTEGAGTMRDQF